MADDRAETDTPAGHDSLPDEAAAPNPPEPAPARGVTVPVAVPVTVALVLGLAIGLILGWVLPRPGDSAAALDEGADAEATPNPTESESQAATVLAPTAPAGLAGGPDGTEDYAGLVIGADGDGPLVEVFEDYVCPFCARLELSAGAQLREAALSGEYRLVVHPIAFLTEDSPRAANASACVYQHNDLDTWVSFHEVVYERQNPSEAVGQYTTEILLGMADEVGAGNEATSACISDGDYTAWVAALTEQSFARGVRGTPTVAVDGTVTDVAPLVQ
jgi:protein-disulfide isomerase